MDRRVLAGFAAGPAGLGAGVAAGIASLPLLGVLAGALALGAAAVVLVLGDVVRRRESELTELQQRMDAMRSDVEQLEEAAAAGREAIRVAGTFAEMVAMRNVELTRQAGGGLLDEPTGLLDGRYFQPALNSRVAAARRLLRPVSVVLLDLEPVDGVAPEGSAAPYAPFAGVLREPLREADTACRIDDTRFGLILE